MPMIRRKSRYRIACVGGSMSLHHIVTECVPLHPSTTAIDFQTFPPSQCLRAHSDPLYDKWHLPVHRSFMALSLNSILSRPCENWPPGRTGPPLARLAIVPNIIHTTQAPTTVKLPAVELLLRVWTRDDWNHGCITGGRGRVAG